LSPSSARVMAVRLEPKAVRPGSWATAKGLIQLRRKP